VTEKVHDSSVLITEEVVYYRRAYPSWPLGPDLGIDRLKARREADLALGRQSASRTPLTAMIDEPLLITTTSVIGPLATPPGARAQRTRPAHDRQGHLRTLLQRRCAATTHTNRKPRHAPLLRCGLVVRLWLSKHAFSFHAFMQAHDNRWPAVFPPTRATPPPFALALSR
jgi:hypothetical protein